MQQPGRRFYDRILPSSFCMAIYARERYAPSEVSTLIFSPSLMNGRTCTTRPVSVFAGLVTLDAGALFSPGSTSVTVNTTACGNSIPTALPSTNLTLIWRLDGVQATDSPALARGRCGVAGGPAFGLLGRRSPGLPPHLGLTVSFYTGGEIVGTWPLLRVLASTRDENPPFGCRSGICGSRMDLE